MILMKSKEKIDFYNKATRNILAQLDALNLSPEKKQRAVKLVQLFREAFTKDEVKKATFIMPDNDIWDLGYDSGGFCRVASITFALAMDFHDWQLMAINDNQWEGKMGHHYLKHIPSGKFFDLTYDQFAVNGQRVPYNKGQNAAYGLSFNDETHKFAKMVGLDIIKMLVETKGK